MGRVVMSPNPSELCPFLLYSNSVSNGILNVYDMEHLSIRRKILAHDSPIVKIAVNFEGDFAATLSAKGNVIRMWNIQNGQKLHTFSCQLGSHGLMDASQITDLTFSVNADHLSICIENGQMLLFNIPSEIYEDEGHNRLSIFSLAHKQKTIPNVQKK